MTKIEFAKGMTFLSACIGKEIPAMTVEAWFLVLGDLDLAAFQRAIVEVVRGHKFPGLPPAGLIRQAAGASGGVIDADTAAIVGWATVIKAIREIGGYLSVRWADPCITVAIESIGESWAALCEKPATELHTWTKKAFVEAYKAGSAAGVVVDGVSDGIIARDAGRIGFKKPEPTQLGQSTGATYGFGGGNLPALRGPVAAEPQRLTVSLSQSFGNLPALDDDGSAAEAAETNSEESRRSASLAALEQWAMHKWPSTAEQAA